MYYAYILRSEKSPDETYIGSTSDLRKRLTEHNSGESIHTNKFKPWKVLNLRCLRVFLACSSRAHSQFLQSRIMRSPRSSMRSKG